MRSSLRTKASAGENYMKEENIVNESESATSLTRSEQGRTTMSKLVKGMAPLCSVYNVDLRSLAEKHVLGVRKDASGNVQLLLSCLSTT